MVFGSGCGTETKETDENDPLPHFSFFVTSLESMRELSGSQNGFGGDLRFGQTGPGAGLRGADKICEAIAEKSMPGSSAKQWRAFLSATADENGNQIDAIDRIGEGPWYDRLGRLVAPTKADLIADRPQNGNSTIQNDLPNEFGVPNHQPDPSQPPVDNHHTLTGSNKQGRLYSETATCLDWTTAAGSVDDGQPRVGLSWPRETGGTGGPPDPANLKPCEDEGDCPDTQVCCDLTSMGYGLRCVWKDKCGLAGSYDGGVPDGGSFGPPDGGSGDGGEDPNATDPEGKNWISVFSAPDCSPGVSLEYTGAPGEDDESFGVGTAGGYGGFYCFALTP